MRTSTLFIAKKTRRPMPNPSGMVTPEAVKSSSASMNDIPMIRPNQRADRKRIRTSAPRGT